VGGLVISALVCTLFHDYFVRSSSALALTGLLLSFVSQSGDLFESYVKRFNGRADVKDTSNLIPGHGGVLDRLDSMFFVAPVLVLFLTFL
jgi:phosphatidate cytidylyltransferase